MISSAKLRGLNIAKLANLGYLTRDINRATDVWAEV